MLDGYAQAYPHIHVCLDGDEMWAGAVGADVGLVGWIIGYAVHLVNS